MTENLIRRLHDKADNLHTGWGLFESAALMREAAAALRTIRETTINELCEVVRNHPEQVLYIYDRPGGPPGNSMVPTTREHLIAAMRRHGESQ